MGPLERNIRPEEFISKNWGGLHGAFEIPNYRRASFWSFFLGSAFCNTATRFQCAPHWVHCSLHFLLVDGCFLNSPNRPKGEVLHALTKVQNANGLCKSGDTTGCKDCTRTSQGSLFP